MKVYKAINLIQADLAKEGISKDRKNQQQGYSFRGIDDLYNALSPLMAKHGLCILPRVLSREVTDRQTAKGGNLFFVAVEMEFDFVCAEDGSKHVVKTFGEAMDSADKATNKAMSAAYKYAAFQAFAIPTEGDNDADSHTHEIQHKTVDVKDFIFVLESAADMDELRKIYGQAFAAAGKDKNALAQITVAKDKRKKELEVNNKPVCTPEQFAELAKEWEWLVRSGKKKAAHAIGAIKTKYDLNQDQEFQISAWESEGQ